MQHNKEMSLKTNDDAYCGLMSLALKFGNEDFTLNGARELLIESVKQGLFHNSVHLLGKQEKTKYLAGSFSLSSDLNEISSALIVSMFIGTKKPISYMLEWSKSKHEFKFSNAFLSHARAVRYRGGYYNKMQPKSENIKGIIYYAT